ncbi:MAG: penicillin-binding protein 2 [Peptococcaceae bacterium]|jgi:penicillin-binding protein 2|nr:penicillin-binding protein 2 [Peptococcaceae bacterium]
MIISPTSVGERKLNILLGIFVLSFLLLVGRLAYLQIAEYGKYNLLATQNYMRLDPVPAARGNIYDRSGHLLVGNTAKFGVSLLYPDMKNKNMVIGKLSALLGEKTSQILQTIGQYKKEGELYLPISLAQNISQATVNKIEEHKYELPGVFISATPERYYPYKDLAAHVLGYVSDITPGELAANPHDGYYLNDQYGQAGIENTYQKYLRGRDGVREMEVNASGTVLGEVGKVSPRQGDNLTLTISARLEAAARKALAAVVKKARTIRGKQVTGGAVVLESVHTGKILAMASYPSYNPAVFTGMLPGRQVTGVIDAPGHPFLNRALLAYPPGSTFKMVLATAALADHTITPSTLMYDPGYVKLGRHVFHNWYTPGFGWMNLIHSIQVSNDTFFWKLGLKLGWQPIVQWAKAYGFGQKTGIRLTGEQTGVVPDPAYKGATVANYIHFILQQKEKALLQQYGGDKSAPGYLKAVAGLKAYYRSQYAWDTAWHRYDTLNMSIGQGYDLVTPLQLADYVATIANGGTRYRPYLVQSITTPSGRLVQKTVPRVMEKLPVPASVFASIKKGMSLVTSASGFGGTAVIPFHGFPVPVGAKTGTAQTTPGMGSDSLFVAFAPVDNPQVAVAAVVEHASAGEVAAAPVVRDVLAAYFHLRLPLESYLG